MIMVEVVQDKMERVFALVAGNDSIQTPRVRNF